MQSSLVWLSQVLWPSSGAREAAVRLAVQAKRLPVVQSWADLHMAIISTSPLHQVISFPAVSCRLGCVIHKRTHRHAETLISYRTTSNQPDSASTVILLWNSFSKLQHHSQTYLKSFNTCFVAPGVRKIAFRCSWGGCTRPL